MQDEPEAATPWEILRERPGCEDFLRPDLSLATLDAQAAAQTDTEAARDMQEAKRCRDSHIPTAPAGTAVSLKTKTERTQP